MPAALRNNFIEMKATTTVVRIGQAAAISVLASVLIAVIAAAESAIAEPDTTNADTNSAFNTCVFFMVNPLRSVCGGMCKPPEQIKAER